MALPLRARRFWLRLASPKKFLEQKRERRATDCLRAHAPCRADHACCPCGLECSHGKRIGFYRKQHRGAALGAGMCDCRIPRKDKRYAADMVCAFRLGLLDRASGFAGILCTPAYLCLSHAI